MITGFLIPERRFLMNGNGSALVRKKTGENWENWGKLGHPSNENWDTHRMKTGTPIE
jgi:hypothetical protein